LKETSIVFLLLMLWGTQTPILLVNSGRLPSRTTLMALLYLIALNHG
jgi:hypothetical protein